MSLYRLGFLLIGPVFASAQVLPAGTLQDPPKCSIEGRVLSLAGEPLRKAKLTLRLADGPPSPNQANMHTADTGADGTFTIHDLLPATYILSAARVGYVIQVYGAKSQFGQGTRLKLDAGQEMKGLVIQLTPEGMIYGKTVDEDGDPVPDAYIAAQRWMYSNGTRQLRPANFVNSQADGSFVIGNLAPGRYVLSASFGSPNYGLTEIANGTPRESNLATFYPDVLDAASAAPLDITLGAALRGIEIRIRRGRAYEIRGHVQNTTSFSNPQGFGINLWTKGSDSALPGMPRFAYIQDKAMTFQFKDLPAGTYVIQGSTQSAVKDERTVRLVGSIEVTIGDASIENAVLPLGTGIEIAGSIQTEGNAPASDSHPHLFIQTSGLPAYTSQNAEAESDGSFRLRGIMPGLYRVNVTGLPDGCYLKSTRFEGQDITGKDLDLTAGHSGELQILVSPNAADVAGVVRNEKGDAVSSAMVQLFDDTRMKSSSSTDQNGAFHLKNLAPGEYKIFAWEDSSSGITQEAESRKNFDATVVKLAEKSHENIELKLILKDAIEAETAKLQ